MLRIAHRGLKSEHPENTIEAFRAAIDAGFDGIELDVRLSSDNELVVVHDPDLTRFFDDDRLVRDISKKEVSMLRFPSGETIPTLEQVLTELPATLILIDVKELGVCETLPELLAATPHKHTIIVGSKKFQILDKLSRGLPHAAQRALITNRRPLVGRRIKQKYNIRYVVQHHWALSWIGIWWARRSGLQTMVYPIRSRLVEKIVSRHKIAGIISDLEL